MRRVGPAEVAYWDDASGGLGWVFAEAASGVAEEARGVAEEERGVAEEARGVAEEARGSESPGQEGEGCAGRRFG